MHCDDPFILCQSCPFVTLCAQRLLEHNCTDPHKSSILKCPGCPNIFASRVSLESHLKHDHYIDPSELNDLLSRIDPQQPAKSRIYIKSVDVLRNPNPTYTAPPLHTDLGPVFDPEQPIDSSHCSSANQQQRQKIYLKNVNELQQQSSNVYQPEFDQFNQAMAFQSQLMYPIPTPPPIDITSESVPLLPATSKDVPSDPVTPQIFIRNVQTLIRPGAHELSTSSSPQPTFMQLPPPLDIEEEVQSLPPQRSDIVVLDDFHEEPPIHNTQFSSVIINDQLKVSSDEQSLSLNLLPTNNTWDCVDVPDDDCLYYKRIEESLPQMILQPMVVDLEEMCEDAGPLDTNSGLFLPLVPAKDDADDLETPPSESPMPGIICLPDESDGDDLEKRTCVALPQMPRIYVSSNLAAVPVDTAEPEPQQPVELPKKVRGRPKGGRNYGQEGNNAFPFQCAQPGCPRRFRDQANEAYHQRCHSTQAANGIACPECGTGAFSNWNTLHSHLWRLHSVDMELYACAFPTCDYKTPCLSTLRNTHEKTHQSVQEGKAFQCDICSSAFKNQKQLKNHRRNHRLSDQRKIQKKKIKMTESKGNGLKCAECDLMLPSGAQLKKHLRVAHRMKEAMTNDTSEHVKIFKCDQCPYTTKFRNSARRHRMMHNGEKKYKCQFCSYCAIQASSFRVRKLLSITKCHLINPIFICRSTS